VSQTAVAGTAAFAKFMHVLQLVADAPHPLAVAELARASGYPRATTHRIVAALLEQGMLAESVPGRYGLGPRLLELASRSWAAFDIRALLAPQLRALRDATGATVHLAVPDRQAMTYIEKLEAPGPVRMVSRIGGRLMLHSSAVGKAYLASLPGAELDAALAGLPLPALMPNTLTSESALRAELDIVRARGYAIDNEENEAGIVCYGVALAGPDGRALAGVSVSTVRVGQADPAACIAPLLELRAAAVRQLTGAGPVAAGAAS